MSEIHDDLACFQSRINVTRGKVEKVGGGGARGVWKPEWEPSQLRHCAALLVPGKPAEGANLWGKEESCSFRRQGASTHGQPARAANRKVGASFFFKVFLQEKTKFAAIKFSFGWWENSVVQKFKKCQNHKGHSTLAMFSAVSQIAKYKILEYQ